MDFLKLYQQQQLLNRIYPKSLLDVIRTQSRLTELLKHRSKLSFFLPVKEPKVYTSVANSFAFIESLNKIHKLHSSLPNVSQQRFAAMDVDFLELTQQNDEEDKNIIIDEAQNVKRIIADIYKDNSKLLLVEARQFEQIIAEILNSQGFEIELTKQTRDEGFDIIAIKKLHGNFPLKFLVECKRYTSEKVGVEVVRCFKNVIDEQNANKGIIVTTSYFTKGAIKKKEMYPYLLDYKDKDDVMKWLDEYYALKITGRMSL